MKTPTIKEYFSEDHYTRYKRTSDPLCVWRMINECDANENTFPDWVVAYLKNAANNLCNIEKPSATQNREIINALGFINTSVFSDKRYEKFELQYQLYVNYIHMHCYKRKKQQGKTIIDEVALAYNTSPATVKNWVKLIKTWVESIPINIIPALEELIINDIETLIKNNVTKTVTIYSVYYRSLNYDYQIPIPKHIIEECYQKAVGCLRKSRKLAK